MHVNQGGKTHMSTQEANLLKRHADQKSFVRSASNKVKTNFYEELSNYS